MNDGNDCHILYGLVLIGKAYKNQKLYVIHNL